jgi:hypothetical protein
MMTLLSWVSAMAQAQGLVQLTPRDAGTTVSLTDPEVAYAVDVTDPRLDLDQLNLVTPADETTFGEVSAGLLRSGAAANDVLLVGLGDGGDLLATFVDDDDGGGNPGECWMMFERRCIFVFGGWRCQWVPVEVCDDDLLPFLR